MRSIELVLLPYINDKVDAIDCQFRFKSGHSIRHYVGLLIVSSMLWITIHAGGVMYLFALLISARHSIK